MSRVFNEDTMTSIGRSIFSISYFSSVWDIGPLHKKLSSNVPDIPSYLLGTFLLIGKVGFSTWLHLLRVLGHLKSGRLNCVRCATFACHQRLLSVQFDYVSKCSDNSRLDGSTDACRASFFRLQRPSSLTTSTQNYIE